MFSGEKERFDNTFARSLEHPRRKAKKTQFMRTIEKAEFIESGERRKRRVKKLAAVTLLLTGLTSMGAANINNNQTVAENSSASIEVISQAHSRADDHKAIIVMNGWGTPDANGITREFGPMIQHITDAQTWSFNYRNASLSINNMAGEAIEKADEEHVDTLELAGYSAGGDIELELAEAIHRTSNLKIETEYFISTPNGLDGLRTGVRSQAADYVKFLDKVSWLEYSDPALFVGEMWAQSDAYTHENNPIDTVRNFIETSQSIYERMHTHQTPGMWLMIDQLLAIQNVHAAQRITNEGKDNNTVHPVLVYLGTKKPGYDYMVNNSWSSKKFQSYAGKAGLDFVSVNVAGAIHTRPDLTKPAYAQAFKYIRPIIQQDIAVQQAIYNANAAVYLKGRQSLQ